MDYKNEVEKLGTSCALSLHTGKYKIKILTEPEETEYRDERENKTVPQIKIDVLVDDSKEIKTWYIGKSVTTKGIFGQLMLIGRFHGRLNSLTINVSVNESIQAGNKTKTYLVDEALPLIQKMEQEVKAKEAAAAVVAVATKQ